MYDFHLPDFSLFQHIFYLHQLKSFREKNLEPDFLCSKYFNLEFELDFIDQHAT